jgi:hypothetical protein
MVHHILYNIQYWYRTMVREGRFLTFEFKQKCDHEKNETDHSKRRETKAIAETNLAALVLYGEK